MSASYPEPPAGELFSAGWQGQVRKLSNFPVFVPQHLELRRVLILLELLGVLVDRVVGQVDTLVPQLLLPRVERLRGEPAQVTAH